MRKINVLVLQFGIIIDHRYRIVLLADEVIE